MAKKSAKMGSDCVPSSYSPSIYLDLDSVKELAGLEVGEMVTVIIQGKVKSLEQREDYEDSKKVKGCLSVSDYEVKITSKDEWEDLAEED